MKRLAVFARAPVAGQVKTRLSPALPAPLAAGLYAALLSDTLAAARDAQADERVVWWTGAAPVPLPAAFTAREQSGADLGARLAHTCDASLAAPGDRVVIVGSDCPSLTAADLDAAFAALETHDVAIGPASDGGYWAIGLSRPAPMLFADMAWSTAEVFARTLARAEAAGLRVASLPARSDLDTPADLAALCGALAAGEAACGPHARALLAGLGLARA